MFIFSLQLGVKSISFQINYVVYIGFSSSTPSSGGGPVLFVQAIVFQ